MTEIRKLAAILAADVVGYSRLVGLDEEQTLARLRALRSDLIEPTITQNHGRIVKRTGDGAIVEFRSVIYAVRCAIEVQNAMIERNAGLPPERRIDFRVGIHLGDVVEESDGDLMGDGVNIAVRLESIAKPGSIHLSDDAYRQVRTRLEYAVTDLGEVRLKNIALPMRVYALDVTKPVQPKPAPRAPSKPSRQRPPILSIATSTAALAAILAAGTWYYIMGPRRAPIAPAPAQLSIVVLPLTNLSGEPGQDDFADGITENLTTDLSRSIRGAFVIARDTAFTFKGKNASAMVIGQQLGVQYVLEGSVQRTGSQVRVSVKLVDTEAGDYLWADRFSADLGDLLELQDDIVSRLARALHIEHCAEIHRAPALAGPVCRYASHASAK